MMAEPNAILNTGTDRARPLDLEAGRRAFLGAVGLGAAAATMGGLTATAAAQTPDLDTAILNFALTLEYLEAEFHLRVAFGVGLPESDVTGIGKVGTVTGGRKVNFTNPVVGNIAVEIADNEKNHVQFLRSVLGSKAVARPDVDIANAFTVAAQAAGIIAPNGFFDAYADDFSFLLAAYNFIDVGVTAYIGSAPLITSKTFLAAAGGLLGTEAYHAGSLRSLIFALQSNYATPATAKISALQSTLSGAQDAQGVGGDQSTLDGGFPSPANIVPTDPNSVAFARTPRQVLNIVYGKQNASRGLFLPSGINPGPEGERLIAQ